jgi:hypothetical protein
LGEIYVSMAAISLHALDPAPLCETGSIAYRAPIITIEVIFLSCYQGGRGPFNPGLSFVRQLA